MKLKLINETDIRLEGLYVFKEKANRKVKCDIEDFQAGRLSLKDLAENLAASYATLSALQKEIDKICPPFSSDDIPF